MVGGRSVQYEEAVVERFGAVDVERWVLCIEHFDSVLVVEVSRLARRQVGEPTP